MKWKKIPCLNIENAPTTITHIEIDLNENEMIFELENKKKLIDELIEDKI